MTYERYRELDKPTWLYQKSGGYLVHLFDKVGTDPYDYVGSICGKHSGRFLTPFNPNLKKKKCKYCLKIEAEL